MIAWFIGSVLVGFAGLNRRGGFFRAFLLGLVLTPLPAIFVVVSSSVKNPVGCNHCGNELNEADKCLVCGNTVV
jgi:hypothetical protein